MAAVWGELRQRDFMKVVTALLLLSLPAGAAFAQDDATFAPAAFGEGEQSLLARLRTPIERPSGNYDVLLTCQVIVEPDGSTRSPRCLTIERYDVFRFEAERALAGATMRPARIEGEPVRVLMSLIVGYRCAETCPAFLFTNHGHNLEEYGFNYSAPQPVLDNDAWYQGFDDKLAWAAGESGPAEVGGVRFFISAGIDESGRPSEQRVDGLYPGSSGGSYEVIAQRAADSLLDARYIPGFYRGESVEMRLHDYWLDPDGAPLDVLMLPVRVQVLWSDLVPALDSTVTDQQIRQMFVEVNKLWQPAAIQWNLESIVRTQAERQLAFRSTVFDDPTGDARGSDETLSQVCPAQNRLEQGWNVCWVRAAPRGALYFYPLGAVMLGEQDILTEVAPPPFALAHALGHLLGLGDAPQCAATFMRWFEGADASVACGNPTPTVLTDEQIKRARDQASTGMPFRNPPVRRRGRWSGRGMGR